MDIFLAKTYGLKASAQIKQECKKKKDLIKFIVIKEL